MAVPYIFQNDTTPIPLSQLDANFATAITLGTTALNLGNTISTVDSLTLTNATLTTPTISSITGPTTITSSVASPFFIANGTITGSLSQGAYSYGTLGYSDSNILGSFATSVNSYDQFIVQNTNSGATASANILVSNNIGTANTYFGEFGMNSSGFTGTGAFNAASTVYLDSTSADLAIGTTTANAIHFVVNGGATDAATISSAGVFSLGTALAVGSGGTGATTLTGYVYGNGTSAMTASTTIPSTAITGLGTMSTQNANAVSITGGSINSTTVGASTASTGAFTTLTASSTVTLSPASANVLLQPTGTGVVTIGPATLGSMNNMTIGGSTAAAGTFTALTANGAITVNTTTNNQSYTTTSTGVITISSGTAGTINNMSIGATTAAAGTFTALTATGAITLNTTSNNQSYTTTGAGTVTISSGTLGAIDNITIGGTTRAAGNFTFVGAGKANSTAAFVNTAAGTTAIAPIQLTSGTNLTTPAAGALEYDGSVFYETGTTTLGRGYVPVTQYFKLTTSGSAIGPTIANYFATASGISLETSAYYELEAELFFTKTTAGTVTFTFTFTQAPISATVYYVGTPVGGVGTVGSPQTAAVLNSTATGVATPATGSLTTAVNHQYKIYAIFQANATTAGTLNLQITSSAGTVTPLALSNYKVRRTPTANTGAFA